MATSGTRSGPRTPAVGGGPGTGTSGARMTRLGRLRERGTGLLDRIQGTGTQSSGASYYLILGSALALTAIGLLMVLSSSAVESIADDNSPFGLFMRQAFFAVLGVTAMLILSRWKPATYRRLAWPALAVSVILLLLVLTPLGESVGGNRNWITLPGGTSLQPSEVAKLGMCLWMAAVLAAKERLLGDWKHLVIPVVLPGALLIVGPVLAGNDLGTAMILMLIIAGGLFFAGAPLKLFGLAGLGTAALVLLLVVVSPNRMGRILMWADQGCETTTGLNMQSCNGLFALASGGWWGVGLGQSRQKYNWIPAAHNDYIFAIIGEELGLLGTMVILALFGVLAIALVRTVMRQESLFVRIFAGSIMVWIIGQAFVNIAVVTGLLPVIGVPLPFISYGGSALTVTLAAVGVLLSFARTGTAGREKKPGGLIGRLRRKTHAGSR